MNFLLSGSSGLVGTALTTQLKASGHQVARLVRRAPAENELEWDPANSQLQADELSSFDGVIHLGGDNIAEGRWTPIKQRLIRESRTKSTELLAKSMAGLDKKPKFFVCASAIGFYGNRGDEELSESASVGSGFLAEVCKDWEASCQPAIEAGIRVVNVRIGVVLSKKGGALAKMLTPFKLGGGGIVGNGKQYWSCVPLDELTSIIQFCIENESIQGPVNAVTPHATTNREFTKTLGRVLNRPTWIPLPAFAAKLILGEMAEDLLLSSTRVIPKKLQESGYNFKYADLESAIRAALGESA